MYLPKYLQDQYIELQHEYDHLTEKIRYFLEERRIGNFSIEEKYNLDKQVEKLQKKREIVGKELDELDRKTKSQDLYRTMLRLGYTKQVKAFLKLVKAQSVQAFLIHGSPKHGQFWLLNRLVTQYVPNSLNGKKCHIHLNSIGLSNDVHNLWSELGEMLGDEGCGFSQEEIIEGVYKWLKTRNVLLVFHYVDFLPEDCLESLVCEFWKPLVHQAQLTSSLQSKYKLLMFLVDYKGTVGSLDKLFTETIEPNQPNNPVKLPKISQFSEQELTDWIERGFGELPVELTHNYEDTVQIILEESDQGIPERVLEGIFERCSFNYREEIKKLWENLKI